MGQKSFLQAKKNEILSIFPFSVYFVVQEFIYKMTGKID